MPFPYEKLSDRPEGQEVPIVVDGQDYSLNSQDTIVRKFRVGGDAFDHVLHKISDQKMLVFFVDQCGGDELRAKMDSARLPVEIGHEPDEFIIGIYMKALDDLPVRQDSEAAA